MRIGIIAGILSLAFWSSCIKDETNKKTGVVNVTPQDTLGTLDFYNDSRLGLATVNSTDVTTFTVDTGAHYYLRLKPRAYQFSITNSAGGATIPISVTVSQGDTLQVAF